MRLRLRCQACVLLNRIEVFAVGNPDEASRAEWQFPLVVLPARTLRGPECTMGVATSAMASIRYDTMLSGGFAATCALTAAVVARNNVREHPALVKFALQDAPPADEDALAAAQGEIRLEKTANLVMRLVRAHPELRVSLQ